MPSYTTPMDDIRFLFNELLDAQKLTKLPGLAEATPSAMLEMIEAAGSFATEQLLPLNQKGDQEGCALEGGKVRVPGGFKEAYAKFVEMGLPGLSGDPVYGGLGLPKLVGLVIDEIICATNLSFGLFPGLSHGAIDALTHWGTEEQKKLYLPKLIAGEWTGTMCLTEPQCGTDLGLLKTKATPNADGTHNISGTKIFISCGDHELTPNIIHLVLARLPDAPQGVKGISLFIVPKYLPDAEGRPGARNPVTVGSLEHKMGLHGCPTCVLNFDDAKGFLIGEPHKGLRGMFTMMNAARLMVGIQGLGLAEASYQNALIYAQERLQGRALAGPKYPDKPADPIIVHPDIRLHLLTMRALIDGCRALAYQVGIAAETGDRHPDEQERARAKAYVELMTPIVKAFLTDVGFDSANRGMQVFGGHGYIRDHGMEQFSRDARIAQIYEGTNGIQALDLVMRKILQDMGNRLRTFTHPVAGRIASAMSDPALAALAKPFKSTFENYQQLTALVATKAAGGNLDEPAGIATSYLRLMGIIALGDIWLQTAKVANERLAEGVSNKAFYESKLELAQFYMKKILPEAAAEMLRIKSGAGVLMKIAPENLARGETGVAAEPRTLRPWPEPALGQGPKIVLFPPANAFMKVVAKGYFFGRNWLEKKGLMQGG